MPSSVHSDFLKFNLSKLDLEKAVCPHCGNDDQDLMAENWFFTHAHHLALNYQCHNRPTCDKYFQIGPLSECTCGFELEESKRQKVLGKEWSFDFDDGLRWAYRDKK